MFSLKKTTTKKQANGTYKYRQEFRKKWVLHVRKWNLLILIPDKADVPSSYSIIPINPTKTKNTYLAIIRIYSLRGEKVCPQKGQHFLTLKI